MANYHQIDVRYAGPSTAYRGSSADLTIQPKPRKAFALPKFKRQPRRTGDSTLISSEIKNFDLMLWLVKRWRGILLLIAFYFTLGGSDVFRLLFLLSSL